MGEKEDEYRQKRRRLVISPERVDPFADGTFPKRLELTQSIVSIEYCVWGLFYLLRDERGNFGVVG